MAEKEESLLITPRATGLPSTIAHSWGCSQEKQKSLNIFLTEE